MRRTRLIVPLLLIALADCSKKQDTSDKVDNVLLGVASGPAQATGDPGGLVLTDSHVQLPAVPGRPAAAYFVLTVGADAKGKLVGVEVAHFARTEMHQSKMEGGAMTMDPVESLTLTPGKPIVFAPGSYHVMLFDGDGTLKPGDRTALTIRLDNGDTITRQAKVTAPGGDDMGGMKM